MLIQLTVRSRNFKAKTAYTEGFESTKMKRIQANQNTAGLPILAGAAEFIYEIDGQRDIYYTVTESAAAIITIAGGSGAPASSGTAAADWTAVEYSTGSQNRTVLTRDTSLVQAIAAANLCFGDQAYNFPLGNIKVTGGVMTFTISAAVETATPEVGLGSVLGAGVQATIGAAGATMEDFLDGTATSAITSAGTDEAYAWYAEAPGPDGTATAADLFFNCAGAWGQTEDLTFSDITIDITWEYLGIIAV